MRKFFIAISIIMLMSFVPVCGAQNLPQEIQTVDTMQQDIDNLKTRVVDVEKLSKDNIIQDLLAQQERLMDITDKSINRINLWISVVGIVFTVLSLMKMLLILSNVFFNMHMTAWE